MKVLLLAGGWSPEREVSRKGGEQIAAALKEKNVLFTALYGIDALIKFKQEDFANCGDGTMTDDVIRLREESQLLRESCAQLQSLFQAEIDTRQNRIMQILTIVTTIFLPLTLLVGWYGMNFVGMPELTWKYGYPVVVIVSIVTVGISLWVCKKKKFW